jgi:hypothetical protein
MAKRIGRPPVPAAEQLSEIVPVRMTAEERRQCEQAAERADLKLSAWIRRSLLRAAKRS